jgi:hypothetical protein
MKLPPLTSEAPRRYSRQFRLVADHPAAREAGQVVPAAEKGSFTIEGHDPDEICLYRQCVFTWFDGPPYFTTKCTVDWVCGHRRQNAS